MKVEHPMDGQPWRLLDRRKLTILVGSLMLLAAAGFAAFFFSTTPITGQATTASAPDVEWVNGIPSATTHEGVGTCNADIIDGTMVITASGVAPGTVCQVEGSVDNVGSATAKLLGTSVGAESAAVESQVLVGGATTPIAEGTCGFEIAPADVLQVARVQLTFTDALQAGETVDLTGGVEWVTSSEYNESLCLQ